MEKNIVRERKNLQNKPYLSNTLKGEKYLEDFYQKNISEIWNDFENGKIRLNSEEVDWGKPVGNEVW